MSVEGPCKSQGRSHLDLLKQSGIYGQHVKDLSIGLLDNKVLHIINLGPVVMHHHPEQFFNLKELPFRAVYCLTKAVFADCPLKKLLMTTIAVQSLISVLS